MFTKPGVIVKLGQSIENNICEIIKKYIQVS